MAQSVQGNALRLLNSIYDVAGWSMSMTPVNKLEFRIRPLRQRVVTSPTRAYADRGHSPFLPHNG